MFNFFLATPFFLLVYSCMRVVLMASIIYFIYPFSTDLTYKEEEHFSRIFIKYTLYMLLHY